MLTCDLPLEIMLTCDLPHEIMFSCDLPHEIAFRRSACVCFVLSLARQQPMAGTLRLNSVSSQDSGFTSQDTLFLRPATPQSLNILKVGLAPLRRARLVWAL